MENKKLTPTELSDIQQSLGIVNAGKIALADATIVVADIQEKLKSDLFAFHKIEKKLKKKYGHEAYIDVRTGEVKPIPKLQPE